MGAVVVIPLWWSILLTVIGVTGVLLVALKKWIGFVVGVAVQVLWIVYAVTTRQWGFIGSAIAYGTVNTIGIVKWMRDRPRKTRLDEIPEPPRYRGFRPHPYVSEYDDEGRLLPEVRTDRP